MYQTKKNNKKKKRYIIKLIAIKGYIHSNCDLKEGLKRELRNITSRPLNTRTVLPTEKIGQGIKALTVHFAAATGTHLSLPSDTTAWLLCARPSHAVSQDVQPLIAINMMIYLKFFIFFFLNSYLFYFFITTLPS